MARYGSAFGYQPVETLAHTLPQSVKLGGLRYFLKGIATTPQDRDAMLNVLRPNMTKHIESRNGVFGIYL